MKKYKVKIVRWQSFTAIVEADDKDSAETKAFFQTCNPDAPESTPTDNGWNVAMIQEVELKNAS